MSFDVAAVERAAAQVTLKLPRVPHRGRVGDVRSASVGSSMELHDFRRYHPGDDVRHIDWNAVARTQELVVRVRQEEVSPRVEVLLDASKSMAVSEAKGARGKEIAAWLCSAAQRSGLEVVLTVLGATPRRSAGADCRTALLSTVLDGVEPLPAVLQRAPPLRPCGLRVVVSDFLVEAEPRPLVERLARHAAGTAFVQVLDDEELSPPRGLGAQLTDSETGEALERRLSDAVVDAYLLKLEAHVAQWQLAVERVRGLFLQVSAAAPVDVLARRELAALCEVA